MGILISDEIARMIEEMLEENGGILELQRNKLATQLGCVPSQINYVITSRFSTDRGYIVESRRGGGGFVRITKVRIDRSTFLMHLLGAVGDSLDALSAKAYLDSLYDNEYLSAGQVRMLSQMLTDRSLSDISDAEQRDRVRAELFKAILLTLKE